MIVWILGSPRTDPLLAHLSGICTRRRHRFLVLEEETFPEIQITCNQLTEVQGSGLAPDVVFNRFSLGKLRSVRALRRRRDKEFAISQWGAFLAALPLCTTNAKWVNAPSPASVHGLHLDPSVVRQMVRDRGIETALEFVVNSSRELKLLRRSYPLVVVRSATGATATVPRDGATCDHSIKFPTVAVPLYGRLRAFAFVGKKVIADDDDAQLIDGGRGEVVLSSAMALGLSWGACLVDAGAQTRVVNVLPYIPDKLLGPVINEVGDDFVEAVL